MAGRWLEKLGRGLSGSGGAAPVVSSTREARPPPGTATTASELSAVPSSSSASADVVPCPPRPSARPRPSAPPGVTPTAIEIGGTATALPSDAAATAFVGRTYALRTASILVEAIVAEGRRGHARCAHLPIRRRHDQQRPASRLRRRLRLRFSLSRPEHRPHPGAEAHDRLAGNHRHGPARDEDHGRIRASAPVLPRLGALTGPRRGATQRQVSGHKNIVGYMEGAFRSIGGGRHEALMLIEYCPGAPPRVCSARSVHPPHTGSPRGDAQAA